MLIRRAILSVLALLPVGPISLMAQGELLNIDAEEQREPFDGNLAKARQMLFPKEVYKVEIDDAYKRFNKILNKSEKKELIQDEKDKLFLEAIDLLKQRGLLKEEGNWISSTTSGWGF